MELIRQMCRQFYPVYLGDVIGDTPNLRDASDVGMLPPQETGLKIWLEIQNSLQNLCPVWNILLSNANTTIGNSHAVRVTRK